MNTPMTSATQEIKFDCFICEELIKDKNYRAAALHQAIYHEGDDDE